MKRKTIGVVFLLCSSLMTYSQSSDSLLQQKKDSLAWLKKTFEGEIVYEIQLLNPNNNIISDEEFYYELPDKGKSNMVMIVKNGSYKIISGDWISLYDDTQGKLYTYKKLNTSDNNRTDTANYTDSKEPKEKLISIVKISDTKKILNHQCQSVETKNIWGSKKYFYNVEALKINPELFKHHFFDDLYPFLKLSKALPLETETNSTLGKSRMTAIRIVEKKIDEAEMKLPNFKTIIKTNH